MPLPCPIPSSRSLLLAALVTAVLATACGSDSQDSSPATPTTTTTPPAAGPGASSVQASLEASRLSGPAPLAVLFDASGTTVSAAGTDAFRQLDYSFSFGDERGQRWAHSTLPKNTQRGGPLAAHVFDQPGTYTVQVQAQGSEGSATATVTVTVLDPDTAFAGAQTVCVSASANYTACPTGALRQTGLPASFAGKRVLLRRGESFGDIAPRNTDSGFQVGAFGSGAKPSVTGVSTGMTRAEASWANDFTVMDLNIGAGSVNIDATTSRMLLYRNDIKSPGQSDAMVNIGSAVGYYQSHDSGPVPAAIYWPREVFIVENDIQGVVDATSKPNLVVMGHFHRSAILGNTIDRATEHSLRVWAASKLVIGHNLIGGNHYAPNPPGIRGAVKIHSGGLQTMTDTVAGSPTPATRQVLLANNRIGSATYPGSFLSGFSPQNADAGTLEGLEDCIAENNVYIRGPYTSSEMQLRGRRLTARGNTVEGGGRPDIVRSGATFDHALDAWDGPYFIQ